MRKTMLLSAAMIGLAAGPALAQATAPAAGQSSASMPQPAGSMPQGSATGTTAGSTSGGMSSGGMGASGSVGTTGAGTSSTGASSTGASSTGMTGTGSTGTARPMHHTTMHHPVHRGTSSSMGRAKHEPHSRTASNISRADTRSDIASALPPTGLGPNANASQYLSAARQALAHNQSGRAQSALEQAETYLLNRSVPAGQGNMADQQGAISQITTALNALGRHDMAGARAATDQAMRSVGGMGGQGAMGQGAMSQGGAGMQNGMHRPMSGSGMSGSGMSGSGSSGMSRQ